MRAQENKCQISQNDTLQNFTFVCTILVKFDIILFSQAPIRNSLWCYYKNVKMNTILFKFYLVQGVCPLKIEIT